MCRFPLFVISFCCNNYTYTYAYRNIFNTIKTSGHSSLEKYTSNFIERVVCERWVGDWTKLQHIDPLLFWLSQTFFPVLLGCLTGGLEAQPLWDMVLIPASSLQLIWTSCRRGYIIIWHPPTSCKHHNFALNSTPRQWRSPLTSWYIWPDGPVIYTGAFLLLTAWPGRRSICDTLCIFLYQIPSLYPDCVFSQFVLRFPILFHFLQTFLLLSFESCSHQCKLIVSHRSLSDNKFLQVSRTLLNNSLTWIVSTGSFNF